MASPACQHGNRITFEEATKRLLDLSCLEKFNTRSSAEKELIGQKVALVAAATFGLSITTPIISAFCLFTTLAAAAYSFSFLNPHDSFCAQCVAATVRT
ncbi:MAG: hypothetical protein S4CHLAM37_12520 [Chlamydiia bacterium]|nr:hypothetical protein [Chlamydiia bacterium]